VSTVSSQTSGNDNPDGWFTSTVPEVAKDGAATTVMWVSSSFRLVRIIVASPRESHRLLPCSKRSDEPWGWALVEDSRVYNAVE
jgi:hypothetical protein